MTDTPDGGPVESPATADAVPQEEAFTGEAVTAETLARQLRAGASISVLDVRDRDEFDAWHVDGDGVTAVQIPHVEFVAAQATGDPLGLLPDRLSEPVVVVCGRGAASDQVAGMLREGGLRAVNLADGMDGFAETLLAVDLSVGQMDEGDSRAHPLADTVVDSTRVTIRQYQRPASGCLSYLVAVDDEAVVIDPLRAFVDRYADDAAALSATLRYAVDTHVHADHVSGVHALTAETTATAVLPSGALDRGFDATQFDYDGSDDPALRFLDDGERLSVGDAELRAIHTPGHTHEHVALVGLGHLFAGDALFLQSVGRPDLESGGGEAARELASAAYDSLHERLLDLPDQTVLLPGHVASLAAARDGLYAASLAAVRELEVVGLDREAFLAHVSENLPPRPANFQRIVAANLGRRRLDEDAAFRAELGPNNCAVSAD